MLDNLPLEMDSDDWDEPVKRYPQAVDNVWIGGAALCLTIMLAFILFF